MHFDPAPTAPASELGCYLWRERNAVAINLNDGHGLVAQYQSADEPVFIIRREADQSNGPVMVMVIIMIITINNSLTAFLPCDI